MLCVTGRFLLVCAYGYHTAGGAYKNWSFGKKLDGRSVGLKVVQGGFVS